jgi:phage baseplate assembly protein W
MATKIIKKSPIDNQPRKAVGVGIPFNAPGVFRLNYTTQDQIKSNLINFFLTNRGERVLNPLFGGNLRATIFEQLSKNTIDNLDNIIRNNLSQYFPRVIVRDLQLTANQEYNSLNIVLTYAVSQTNIEDTLNIDFN